MNFDKNTVKWRNGVRHYEVRQLMMLGYDYLTAVSIHRARQKIRECFTPMQAVKFKASLRKGE